MKYDIVIVGAGLAGCVAASMVKNKMVLIVDKRDHIGGNCYDYYNEHGILVHKYGPHFFHTDDRGVFKYLSMFTDWHYYQHKVLVYDEGHYIPFPQQAKKIHFTEYTKKQWGKWADKLDPSVVGRIRKSNDTDERYFEDKYQVMPKYGYTYMLNKMISRLNISLLLNTDWLSVTGIEYELLIYTGCIDEFFTYCYGTLPYRSLRFEHETFHYEYYQPEAQVNYPRDYDFTRIIEIKHATGQIHPSTTIVKEYPMDIGTPYYPIPCKETKKVYDRYLNEYKSKDRNVILIGRLAEYKYLNMDQVVRRVLDLRNSKWKSWFL